MSLFPEKYHHFESLNRIVNLKNWRKRKEEAEEYLKLIREQLKENPISKPEYHELNILEIHIQSVIADCEYRIKNI